MKHTIIRDFIALSLLAFVSCRKSDTSKVMPEPTPTATITIASPTTDQTFRLGDIMNISAVIEGNVKLHGYHLAIVNTATGDTVFKADDHTHALTLNVAADWQCDVSSSSDLKLFISSALNHDGLEVVKTVSFKAAP